MTSKLLVVEPAERWVELVEDVGDLGLGGVELIAGLGLDGDRVDRAVAGQRVLHGGQRREGDVVLVGRAVRALGVGHPDDLEVGAVDLDGLADRVLAAEQLADHRRPDHQDAVVAVVLRRW